MDEDQHRIENRRRQQALRDEKRLRQIPPHEQEPADERTIEERVDALLEEDDVDAGDSDES